jgi:hypothetical protein
MSDGFLSASMSHFDKNIVKYFVDLFNNNSNHSGDMINFKTLNEALSKSGKFNEEVLLDQIEIGRNRLRAKNGFINDEDIFLSKADYFELIEDLVLSQDKFSNLNDPEISIFIV